MSIARHTTYNLLGSITPIAVTLITVPLYIQSIGIERYGILSLCWLLAGYFTFLDFGIGRATAQRMARNLHAAQSERNALFWSSLSLSATFAVLGFAVALAAVYAFLPHLDVTPALVPEIEASLVALALSVPLGIMQSLLTGTLEGRRSFGAVNVILATGTILTAGMPLLAAMLWGPELLHLIVATLVARAITVALLLVCCRADVPVTVPGHLPSREWKSLVQFGAWASITAVVSPMLVYFDRFAIGALLGGAAVGYYVIGFNIIMQMLLIPTAFSRALFPHFAATEASKSARQGADATGLLLLVAMLMATLAMALIGPFLYVWLGPEIARQSAPVTVILLVGFWANSAAQSAFTHLHSKARPDLPAKAHLAELIPYFVVFYAFTLKLGIIGAAIAWTLRVACDFAILQLIEGVERRLALLIGATFAIVLAGAAAQLLIPDPWLRLGAGLAIFLAAAAFAYRAAPERAAQEVGRILSRLRPVRDML